MNIGDKVRFLNTVGGGKITGFGERGIVLVCDDDGFEIPTLASEVVVVDTGNDFQRHTPQKSKKLPCKESTATLHTGVKTALNRFDRAESTNTEDEMPDPSEKEITFRRRPTERRGADMLNLYLGFVPIDIKALGTTRFEAYLINDSNFYISYILLTQEGSSYRLRHEGRVEPNQKIFLEEFSHAELPELERITVQLYAYKVEKSFSLKAPLNVTLRLDGTKFYKLHVFGDSDFFDGPSLVRDLVRDDRPARSVSIAADQLQEAMVTPSVERQLVQPARSAPSRDPGTKMLDRNAIIEVDLHAETVLDSTAGMLSSDILTCQLRVFHDTMRAHAKEHGRRIVFIHGKGEGVLRAALLKELKRHYPHCTHQDASFREYGFGATMVTIH